MNYLYTILKNEHQSILSKKNKVILHVALIIFFTTACWVLSRFSDMEEERETFSDFHNCVYYGVITHFTVGFGDIVPKSKLYRYLTLFHVMLTALLFTI